MTSINAGRASARPSPTSGGSNTTETSSGTTPPANRAQGRVSTGHGPLTRPPTQRPGGEAEPVAEYVGEKATAARTIARNIQKGVRGLIERREAMITEKPVTGEAIKALMLNPAMGERPSLLASSKIVGKQPFPKGISAEAFNSERTLTRDAYRRVLETNVAAVMLNHPHYSDAPAEKMKDTEDKLRKWVEDAAKKVDDDLSSGYWSDDWNNRLTEAEGMLKALYPKEPSKLHVYPKNEQKEQFANGIAQASEEGGSELAKSSLRVAGLLQAVAWLAPTQDLSAVQRDIVGAAKEAYEGGHPHFAGRGRVPAEGESANRTRFKGIITSERAPLLESHYLSREATRAQTTNGPEHHVPQRPGPNENALPAWLTEPTARKMPFVNSISGLGLLSAIADGLNLLPTSKGDKQDFYALVTSAQLYFVGGHSFHEFLSGAEAGQNYLKQSKEDILEQAQENHGIDLRECLERIPSEVYEEAAKRMNDAARQAT